MDLHLGSFSFATEADTADWASAIAPHLKPSDTLLLSGAIGAGKSAFARALIRARLTNPSEEVPSPTFTTVQTYPHEDGDIWHCDLYRLQSSDEALELGLDEAFETAICLIEWPDRLGDLTPRNALRLAFEAGPNAHRVEVSGPKSWAPRLEGLS
jgi:tRNA threonylcarbamoyladenosine biosynthesis protein TsaE